MVVPIAAYDSETKIQFGGSHGSGYIRSERFNKTDSTQDSDSTKTESVL